MVHLVMANNLYWHRHVLRMDDGHVLEQALDFEFEGQCGM